MNAGFHNQERIQLDGRTIAETIAGRPDLRPRGVVNLDLRTESAACADQGKIYEVAFGGAECVLVDLCRRTDRPGHYGTKRKVRSPSVRRHANKNQTDSEQMPF